MSGPVIGGVLFSIVGLKPILYVSIGCFLISAIMEIFIHIPFYAKTADRNIFVTGFGDLKDSFNYMFRKQTVLWKMSLFYASVNLFLNPLVLIGIPVLVTQYLGFSANIANKLYGYSQGIIAAGSVLGGLLAGTLSKKLTPKSIPFIIIGGSLFIFLIGIALQSINSSIIIYIILVAGCTILLVMETLFTVQIMSYVQTLTPNNLIGKITSCVICLCMCTNPVGQFIYGAVFEITKNCMYLPFYGAALIMIIICIFSRSVFNYANHIIKNN